jgi:hypothetical protein
MMFYKYKQLIRCIIRILTKQINLPFVEQTNDRIHCHARSQSSLNTPTKKKLRRIINKKDQQIYRLKQRINVKKPNNKSKREAIKILQTMLPAKICNFVKSQIDLHANKSKKGNRYSSETKAFSLSLYHMSEKAELYQGSSAYQPSRLCSNGSQGCQTALVLPVMQ